MKKITAISKTTAALKKGKTLKAKKKKETIVLRAECPHHFYDGKKLKSRIKNNGDGTCTCKLCKEQFRTIPFTFDEIDEAYENIKEITNQAKFMAARLGIANNCDYLCSVSGNLTKWPKVVGKTIKAAKKEDGVKKKKKGGSNSGMSNQYGQWSIGRHR